MRLIKLIGYVSIIFISATSFYLHPSSIDKISASILIRQVESGKSVTIKGEVFYRQNGNLVTHFTYPHEYVLMANNFGEIKIYDPFKNTVIQFQNFLFSTQSSQFYYFFTGKTYDMGLTNIGYVQEKTEYENNLRVTEWKLKVPDKKALIQKVKLVFENQRPIYMDYQNLQDKIIRKVFYYNYTQLENFEFPAATTDIIYNDKDSTVSKTLYSDFKINNETTSAYFNYSIPENAKSE
jgi:outer membrane lipoprotein-sorting protein